VWRIRQAWTRQLGSSPPSLCAVIARPKGPFLSWVERSLFPRLPRILTKDPFSPSPLQISSGLFSWSLDEPYQAMIEISSHMSVDWYLLVGRHQIICDQRWFVLSVHGQKSRIECIQSFCARDVSDWVSECLVFALSRPGIIGRSGRSIGLWLPCWATLSPWHACVILLLGRDCQRSLPILLWSVRERLGMMSRNIWRLYWIHGEGEFWNLRRWGSAYTIRGEEVGAWNSHAETRIQSQLL